MNKEELIELVAGATGETKAHVSKTLDAMIDQITGALQRGDRVQLTGFGTFEVRRRKARKARHPRTGETIYVPPQTTTAFKGGKTLVEEVRGRSPVVPSAKSAEELREAAGISPETAQRVKKLLQSA